jgi:hypothetical protein
MRKRQNWHTGCNSSTERFGGMMPKNKSTITINEGNNIDLPEPIYDFVFEYHFGRLP